MTDGWKLITYNQLDAVGSQGSSEWDGEGHQYVEIDT